MKKIEKEFLNDFNNDKHNVAIENIMNKVDTSQYKKKSRRFYERKSFWGILTGALATIALVISLSIYYTRPYVVSIRVNNLNDLVTEYELNSNLILDNLKIEKEMSNGKVVEGSKEDLIIDSSSFNSLKPGDYTINLALKKDENINTSYSVRVINETLEAIEVSKLETRSTYYQGETIKPEEIKVMKKRSKSKAIAKPAEILIDDSKVKYNEVGNYNINISLKTNNMVKDNYSVDIKDIVELEINDRFYMSDDSYIYPPTILGMDIMSDVFIPYYSDIVLEGAIIKTVEDGNIILKDNKHNQKGIYNPYLGVIEVTGLTVSDKPIYLYRMDSDDKLITLITEKGDRFYTFVALDKHLDENTLNYLNDAFGSVYLDKERTEQIFLNTVIENDSNIYVNLKSDPGLDNAYLGKYVNENNIIVYDIISDGIRTYTNKNYADYYVRKANNGLIVINIRGSEGSGSKLCYDEKTDSLLRMEGKEVVERFRRFDPENQIIVTIQDKFSLYSIVHDKGFSYDLKHPVEVLPDKLLFLDGINYNGEKLYSDTSFVVPSGIGYLYLTDFMGRYGVYNNYIYVSTNFSFNIEANRMKVCYQIVKDLNKIETGYLSFNKVSYDQNDKRIIEFKLEDLDGNSSYASLSNYSNSYLGMKGILNHRGYDYYLNDSNFLLDLDIVGEYEATNGSRIKVNSNGTLEFTIIENETLSHTYYETIFIKEVKANEIIAYYHYQNSNDELELREISFKKLNDTKYEFGYKGNSYQKII